MTILFASSFLDYPIIKRELEDSTSLVLVTSLESLATTTQVEFTGVQCIIIRSKLTQPMVRVDLDRIGRKVMQISAGHLYKRVVFCDFYFCELEFYIMRFLMEQNLQIRCFFAPPISTSFRYRTPYDLASWIRPLVSFLQLNVKVMAERSGKKIFYRLAEAQLYALPRLKHNPSGQAASSSLASRRMNLLWLTGGVVEEGLVGKSNYVDEIREVIEHAIDVGYSVTVKSHPRLNRLHGLENHLTSISSSLPAVSIMGQYQLVVGYNTSALFESLDQGCIAISIIDILTPLDEDRSNNFKRYLEQNGGGRVLFPESAKDFRKIMEEVRDRK